ncbi:MAG: hypothetical protein HKN36_13510 [Hellea sp.]|nr:hypothetical protein [Hellea sp.]
MSGIVLNQEVVDVEIDIGSGFVPFPCVTQAELGETSVERIKTTCFSSPNGSPEYAVGEVDVGEGSVTYNVALADNVHQFLVENQGSKTAIQMRITVDDGTTTYTLTRAFLNMGVSEPFNINEIFAATLKIQATGAATRAFAASV